MENALQRFSIMWILKALCVEKPLLIAIPWYDGVVKGLHLL